MLKPKGFSLVEMLIAGVLGLVVFGGMINLFIASDSITEDTVQNGELQEVGTYALNVLTKDLMMHGYFGEYTGSNMMNANLHASAVSEDCTGENGNNGSFPNTSDFSFRTLWMMIATGVDDFGCIVNAKAGSTILQIKRGISDELDPGDEKKTRYYIKSNRDEIHFYAGNDQASVNTSMAKNLIMEYQNRIYYVRIEDQGGISVPILARYQLEKAEDAAANAGRLTSYDLAEGIEYINFLMGVDNNSDGVANFYLPVADMATSRDYWDQSGGMAIVSAKVFVLARALTPDESLQNKNSYDLGSWIFTAKGDGYRRMLFTNTVYIANKGLQGWVEQ
ncbi:PilW family protein [Algibacillus agarilyticus]|uniref:PilW family protein n=1 Tax=Algibacillus agarilyticus TaxID=2234133 RepID=UPI000DD07FAB|nr:PilW family protein [Algibacillus agarilyticus]